MTDTNEKSCVLAGRCRVAGTPQCTRQCSHFISLHGASGEGGRVGSAGFPRDYRLVTLENSPARASQAAVYANLEKYVGTFERMFEDGSARIKSLYLYSETPGTGKTTSAAAVLNEWLTAHYIGSLKRGKQALQRPAYFFDVNEAQTLYNEFARSNIPREVAEKASREYYRRLDAAKSAPFAVYDDIGVRSATEGFRGDIHSAINHRTMNAMPTVFTSNLPIEEMERVFDARLYDRMRDQCSVQSFVGESKRGRR